MCTLLVFFVMSSLEPRKYHVMKTRQGREFPLTANINMLGETYQSMDLLKILSPVI